MANVTVSVTGSNAIVKSWAAKYGWTEEHAKTAQDFLATRLTTQMHEAYKQQIGKAAALEATKDL